MKRCFYNPIIGGILLTYAFLFFSCKGEDKDKVIIRDYPEIIASGILHAVTEYNSISFHAQEDTITGLHYELLQAFAKDKGLNVEITPEMSLDKRTTGMEKGIYDILANNVLVTTGRKDSMLFTHPLLLSKQVLVQRKPQSEQDSNYIHNQLELAQKTLHIVKGAPSIYRIHNLSNEIGDTIYIQEVDKYGMEQLLAMVAHGEIDYAVCDENIAKASLIELPILDIQTDISFTQFYSWGVNKNSPILLDSLNTWIDRYKQTSEYRALLKKYAYPTN